MAERPDVVVIVSSDSDFAPLVIRLREKGCRVWGIGQQGKTGDDSMPVYDDFIDLTHKGRAGAAARKRASVRAVDVELEPTPARRRRAGRTNGAAPRGRGAGPGAPVANARQAPKRRRTTNPLGPSARHAPLPDDVMRILDAVPDLWRGRQDRAERRFRTIARRQAARPESATSSRLFKKFPTHFALTPERQPNKVQYIGPRVV